MTDAGAQRTSRGRRAQPARSGAGTKQLRPPNGRLGGVPEAGCWTEGLRPWLPAPVTSEATPVRDARDAIPFRTAVRAWFAISLQTFGGPAGQIAVMQRTLVDEKRWIGQRRFLHAMNYCMLLPGPEAQQLADRKSTRL